MKKSKNGQWKHLEATEPVKEEAALSYPTSARVKHDWDEMNRIGEETEKEQSQSADEFFKKLYANASEDTRRAMMKSFV